MSYNGYQAAFLLKDGSAVPVSLPLLNERQQEDLVSIADGKDTLIHYPNFSLQLSVSRKLPFYTASNIDGALFKKAERASQWKKDKRVGIHQWGEELYKAENSNFDKGHMTKREDVQWGITEEEAQLAADSTFFYPNAVPQHKHLNQDIWKKLETYILHTEARKRQARICVFTGPVLQADDPYFITEADIKVQLPVLFWKVVYFMKSDGRLCRVGFLMSQRELLKQNAIISTADFVKPLEANEYMEFEEAATFQVNVPFLEKLTGMTFHQATDSYQDKRSTKLILKEVEVEEMEHFTAVENQRTVQYSIQNITL